MLSLIQLLSSQGVSYRHFVMCRLTQGTLWHHHLTPSAFPLMSGQRAKARIPQILPWRTKPKLLTLHYKFRHKPYLVRFSKRQTVANSGLKVVCVWAPTQHWLPPLSPLSRCLSHLKLTQTAFHCRYINLLCLLFVPGDKGYTLCVRMRC